MKYLLQVYFNGAFDEQYMAWAESEPAPVGAHVPQAGLPSRFAKGEVIPLLIDMLLVQGLSPRDAKDQVFVTCIPWLEFTAIQHPTTRLGRWLAAVRGVLTTPESAMAWLALANEEPSISLIRAAVPANVMMQAFAYHHLVPGRELTLETLTEFDPRKCIERMREATVFMGVPTLYTRMLAEAALTRDAVRNMRLFVSGSAPLLYVPTCRMSACTLTRSSSPLRCTSSAASPSTTSRVCCSTVSL